MPTEARRGLPYIWVTWLAGVLSGDKACRYAPWFKAHHQYEKRPANSEFLSKWKADHVEMVHARVQELRADGWDVFVEGQNKFTIKGAVALLGGGPDIIATRDVPPDEPVRGVSLSGEIPLYDLTEPLREAQIHECKTGQRRDADYWQLVIYMLFAPQAFKEQPELDDDGNQKRPHLEGRHLSGALAYKDGDRTLNDSHAGDDARAKVVAAIREAAGATPPKATPSFAECDYCDIAACQYRVTEDTAPRDTEDF